jgi:hypothetical protein
LIRMLRHAGIIRRAGKNGLHDASLLDTLVQCN